MAYQIPDSTNVAKCTHTTRMAENLKKINSKITDSNQSRTLVRGEVYGNPVDVTCPVGIPDSTNPGIPGGR